MIPIPTGFFASAGLADILALSPHRWWRGKDIVADGSNNVTSWADIIASAAATPSSVKKDDQALQITNNTNNSITLPLGTFSSPASYFFVVNFQGNTSAGDPWHMEDAGTVDLRESAGGWTINAGSALAIGTLTKNAKSLCDFIVPAAGDSTFQQRPTAEVVGAAGNTTGSAIRLGRNGVTGFNNAAHWYEVLVFNRVLNSSERATVYASMQSLHPGI